MGTSGERNQERDQNEPSKQGESRGTTHAVNVAQPVTGEKAPVAIRGGLIELGCLGEGVEGGDGFDQASYGEGVEDAAGQADQMERATVAAE